MTSLALGGRHTCALLSDGGVRCWGFGTAGRLGYGNTDTIGDDEHPNSQPLVSLGQKAVQITAGYEHTCALLVDGSVRCWGRGDNGALGYGNPLNIGDDEVPSSTRAVDVGARVLKLVAGASHTCALLEGGRVRCWGHGAWGQLGYANTRSIGDDESPAAAGDVNIGGHVTDLAAGGGRTCALLAKGRVRCWGYGGYASALGYGHSRNIGDDETPASAGDVNVGGRVNKLALGEFHTCARMATGGVRCWGEGRGGRLGYGNNLRVGIPADAGDVNIGGSALAISAGEVHTCALLDRGNVRCWGMGKLFPLGYGGFAPIGDDELPASVGDLPVVDLARGESVSQVFSGANHRCVLLTSGAVRCWGHGQDGALGYGNRETIGDYETPLSAGDVLVL